MSDLRGSSEKMRELLGAARADGPLAASRSKIWAKVSNSVGAVSAGGAGGAGAAKLLATGTLFGGTLTVGVTAAVLFLRAAPGQAASAATTMTAAMIATATAIMTPTPTPTLIPTPTETMTATETVSPSAISESTRVNSPPANLRSPFVPSAAAGVRPDPDPLAREASLVADARNALARDAPLAALRAVRATRAIAHRQLIPEELSVEAQALRVLGRTHEADAIEAVLRSRYPESALAR